MVIIWQQEIIWLGPRKEMVGAPPRKIKKGGIPAQGLGQWQSALSMAGPSLSP
jgi:hypothetical protein